MGVERTTLVPVLAARSERATAGSAAGEVRRSRALRNHLPLTHQALADGQISSDHVKVLTREAITTQRLREQLHDEELGESFLVTHGRQMGAGEFSRLVKAWALAADPEAADRAWREDDAKEEFTIAPTTGGYHLAGWLDTVSGQVVHTALSAHMGRKAKGDVRTPAQRRANALVSLAHQSLDAGQQAAHARVRPHLTVTATWETLRALAAATGSSVPTDQQAPAQISRGREWFGTPGLSSSADDLPFAPGGDPLALSAIADTSLDPSLSAIGGPRDPGAPADSFDLSPEARAWMRSWRSGDDHVISTAVDHEALIGVQPATLEDGTPIPPALLARLACDSGLTRVVFGPRSTVLDVGREQRIFPANMTRAIIARDRHCQFPGCDEPPGFGEIHHSLQWYRDHGPTDVEHGVLLCWHHHDLVHARTITITRTQGRWSFTDRNGEPLIL